MQSLCTPQTKAYYWKVVNNYIQWCTVVWIVIYSSNSCCFNSIFVYLCVFIVYVHWKYKQTINAVYTVLEYFTSWTQYFEYKKRRYQSVLWCEVKWLSSVLEESSIGHECWSFFGIAARENTIFLRYQSQIWNTISLDQWLLFHIFFRVNQICIHIFNKL